ncbi:hypothetical protein GGTG_01136 [Gaeumannomyces tritici R3-111a-1]|uniref:Uncharacterized protein n=1 Tax=Gaeumannomyces tritici (strain R3-111a-1) TaxID=644352 RepID=J3NIQ3_GAET3|nr:hypothetical protein GGTG_01136 [Gaeumannomyces tritici R3-111a-1]EJT81152.1 hypothetical protein GGTG_01136 [Gaeumannomyces tritici R3-111a-1]
MKLFQRQGEPRPHPFVVKLWPRAGSMDTAKCGFGCSSRRYRSLWRGVILDKLSGSAKLDFALVQPREARLRDVFDRFWRRIRPPPWQLQGTSSNFDDMPERRQGIWADKPCLATKPFSNAFPGGQGLPKLDDAIAWFQGGQGGCGSTRNRHWC